METIRERIFPNIEKQFLLDCFISGTRADGRSPKQYRKCSVNYGENYGDVDVKLGETRVTASTSLEIEKPARERAYEGRIVFHVDIPPMASPYLDNRNFLPSMEIIRMQEHTIRDNGAIDLEPLCIMAHEKAWAVFVDIVVINHEGNILDACICAAVSSLLYCRIPQVTRVDTSYIIHPLHTMEPIKLRFFYLPISSTFQFYGDEYVVDARIDEEVVSESFLFIASTMKQEICYLYRSPSYSTNEKMFECIDIANTHAIQLGEYIQDHLNKTLSERNKKNTREVISSRYILPGETKASTVHTKTSYNDIKNTHD